MSAFRPPPAGRRLHGSCVSTGNRKDPGRESQGVAGSPKRGNTSWDADVALGGRGRERPAPKAGLSGGDCGAQLLPSPAAHGKGPAAGPHAAGKQQETDATVRPAVRERPSPPQPATQRASCRCTARTTPQDELLPKTAKSSCQLSDAWGPGAGQQVAQERTSAAKEGWKRGGKGDFR